MTLIRKIVQLIPNNLYETTEQARHVPTTMTRKSLQSRHQTIEQVEQAAIVSKTNDNNIIGQKAAF